MEAIKLTYRQILKKAWQVTWRNPTLWFFGFFVSFLGVGGEIEVLLESATLQGGEGTLDTILAGLVEGLAEGGIFTFASFQGLLIALLNQPISLFIVLLLLLTVLGLVVGIVWLVITSQGALINKAISLVQNKKLSWPESFKFGLMKFWPIAILNALAKVITGSLFVVLGLLAILNFPGSTLIFIAAFVPLVAVIIVMSFTIKFAVFGVVLRSQKVGDALDSALKLLARNWLLSLEIAFILFLIYIFTTSLLTSILYVIFLVAVRFFYALPILLWVILIAISIAFILSQILLAIFHWTTWILVFEIITSQKASMVSRLVNGFGRIFK